MDKSFEPRVEKVADLLVEKYDKIAAARATIEQNINRANGICGPVTHARSAIVGAQIAIKSAESFIAFVEDVAKSGPDDGFVPEIAQAALVAAAKRRSA